VACASAERRGSEGTAGAPCLLPSTVAARAQQASRRFCRAPSPGAAAARAQQPGANERFGFWALFGPVWPRRAPRGSRAPSSCTSTQGRGSKQGPVLLSPAPLRPWQGPGRFRKRAETNTKVLRIFFFRPSAGCVAYEYFWSSFVFETEFRRPLVDRSQRCVGGGCGGSGLCHIF
jgi:hypothetical protein